MTIRVSCMGVANVPCEPKFPYLAKGAGTGSIYVVYGVDGPISRRHVVRISDGLTNMDQDFDHAQNLNALIPITGPITLENC